MTNHSNTETYVLGGRKINWERSIPLKNKTPVGQQGGVLLALDAGKSPLV